MKIDYGFACGPKAEIFVPSLLQSIKNTVRNINDFTFYVGITAHSNKPRFIQQLKNQFKDLNLVIVINPKPIKTQASVSHGSTLDLIYKQMNGDIGVFSDIDILFTMKHWDTICDRITDKKVIIGSEYEKGTYHYLDYPNAYFCIFNIVILKQEGITWSPHPSIINSRKEDKKMKLDTGYQLYYKLRPKNYDYEIIKLVIQKNGLQYFAHEGIVIFIHLKKGRRVIKGPVYNSWAELVKQYAS